MNSSRNGASPFIPRILGLASFLAGGIGLTPAVLAADTSMEEIIVTATRREASLQDVPVSVSVVSGEQIREQSLQNLDDLSNWVPGLSVREGGEQTGISLRGFGTGLNFGFDQSVGLFIDGMYSGRERQFRARFLDVSSVEVLRGPQATLFGKNTISGAIIIRTGEPQHDFDMNVKTEVGVGVRPRKQVEGFVTGELSDSIAGRLALRWSDDDGYTRNTYTGEKEEQEKDWVIRPTFLWTVNDNLEAKLKLEYAKYKRRGRGFQVSDIGGAFSDDTTGLSAAAQLSSYLAYDPQFEYALNNLTSKQLETADVSSRNAVLEISYDLGQATLTSVTGFSGFISEDGRDVDWTPTSFLYEPISQDFKQYSQEFRLVSEVGEKFDYILGLYAFGNQFYVDRRTDINIEVFLIPFGVSPGDDIIFGGPAENWRYAQLRYLDQATHNQSAYGQATWHFTPGLHLTAGLRWNREHKAATDRYNLSEFGTDRFLDLVNNQADIDLINGIRTVLAGNVNGILANSREGGGDLVEIDWSPELTLSWDATDTMMFYGKYTRGHKGGGFNSQTTGQGTDPKFEDETVDGYELGGKFRFESGYLNAALFRQDFTNLQTSVWTGNEFDVGNAGEARSQGLELEGRYLLTDSIQINGGLILLDAKYIENHQNACSVTQLTFGAPGCFDESGVPYGDPAAVAPYFQDLTGERFSPPLQGNFGIGYVRPMLNGMELLLRADATYFDHSERANDRTIEEPAVTIVDVAATLRQTGGPWSVGLLVKNATGKLHWWYQFEAPAQSGTRIGFYAPPRTVAFRLVYNYN